MEPFTMMLMMGAGLAMKAGGDIFSAQSSKASNQAQIQQIQLEQKVEEQRRTQMEMENRRSQLQNLRSAQQARSVALTSSTNSGANLGSGLQGGFSQIAGESNYNALGLRNSLQIGENTFDLNAQISNTKISMANANKDMQLGKGISSFGSSIYGAAAPTAKLATNYFGGSTPSSSSAGGDIGWG